MKLKVRDELDGDKDPGWYHHPEGTIAEVVGGLSIHPSHRRCRKKMRAGLAKSKKEGRRLPRECNGYKAVPMIPCIFIEIPESSLDKSLKIL